MSLLLRTLLLSVSAGPAIAQEVGEIEPAVPFGQQVSASGITHSFLITGSRTSIISEDCEIVWEAEGRSRDGYVLKNGNVLVSHQDNVVREYQRDGRVVFSYRLSEVNDELGTAVRLDDGFTLIVERGPEPRLVEVSPAGEIRVAVPLQPDTDNGHMQTRMARKLPNGNYLVPHLLGFAVKEYQPDGKVVHTLRTDLEELGGRAAENWPFTAIRLASGNTLINLTHGNKTVELDREGAVAWRVDNVDVDGRFQDPCGGQRLRSGNTVICSYAQQDPKRPKLFEVNREKEVVWEYLNRHLTGVHEVHVLTTNGQPTLQPPLK